MGGWLSTFEEWEKVSNAWATELKFPPSIEYFKHNEAMGLKEQFAHWTEKDRDKKLESLAGVIARHDLIGFVGGIGIPKFKALFDHSILPKKALRNIITFTEPYHFGCQCMISMTLGYQVEIAKNLNDQVDFIFDEGVRCFDDCVANYPKLKSVLPPKAQAIAGTVLPGNDKHIVALQAADLLVGQVLLNLRTGIDHPPLNLMKAIFQFNCLPKHLEGIPKAVSRVNAAWATKQLDKAKRKGN